MSNTSADSDGFFAGVVERLASIETRHYKLVFFGFLLVWLLYLLWASLSWPWTDKLFPFIAGVPAVIMVTLKIVKNLYPERYEALKPEPPTVATDEETNQLEETYKKIREGSDTGRPRRERIAYAVRMIVWALALPLLMYLIGFSNALPLFIFAFGLRFYDSLKATIAVTIVFTVLMFGFFYVIMGIPVWDSVLGIPSFAELLGIA